MSGIVGGIRLVAALAVSVATLLIFPGWWCGRDAGAWFAGDLQRQRELAKTVARQVDRPLGANDFFTGSGLFSGEWLFGTYLMAGIGFCQIVSKQPETAAEYAPLIERCIGEITTPRVAEFDTVSWSRPALEDLDGDRGHAAYLGYLNFLLGLYREVAPGNRFVELNDRVTLALERRFAASPNGFIETYPGEWYPVDNAPALASIALRRNFADASRHALVASLIENYRRRAFDPTTGLLIQALTPDGRAADAPRGSGTALAAFFFRRDLAPLGRELYGAMRRELAVNLAGFGAMREYPQGLNGRGDIDSGPVVCGLGFSASGFAIGGARMHRDEAGFRRLWASAQFGGAPVTVNSARTYVTAGPLGNAILLAMATSPGGGGAMKIRRATARRLVIDCAALVALQIVLLHVLARTNLLEKLMAGQFNRWEFGAIVGFVVLRFAVYFLVPAFLAGLATWKILGVFGKGRLR